MAERRERPPVLLEGKEELRAEMEPVVEEEPLELPEPKKRKRKTKEDLKEKLTPASKSHHALDERGFVLEKEIGTQKEKERKIGEVLEAAKRKVKTLEKEYAAAWFGRGRLQDDLKTAEQTVQLIEDSIKKEKTARKELETEQRALERQQSKLLSAMQPDVRELKKLERRESFEKTLPEMVTYIKTQKNGRREQKKEETVRMMMSTYPEFEEEIKKAFAEIT